MDPAPRRGEEGTQVNAIPMVEILDPMEQGGTGTPSYLFVHGD